MKRAKLIGSILSVAVLSACAHDESGGKPVALANVYHGTKLLPRPDCVVMPQKKAVGVEGVPAAVLLALAPKAIDVSISAFVSYLRGLKESYSATIEARAAGQFYDPYGEAVTRRNRCYILVRGEFGDKVVAQDTGNDPIWNADKLASVGLTRPPEFYLEMAADQVQDTHFRVRPVFLDYPQKLSKRAASGKKDLVVTVTFKTVGVEAGKDGGAQVKDSTIATFSLALKQVPIGVRLSGKALDGLTSEAQLMPASAAPSKDGKSIVRDLAPYTALATVSETEDAGLFYLKMAEVLEGSKDKASAELLAYLRKILDVKEEDEKS